MHPKETDAVPGRYSSMARLGNPDEPRDRRSKAYRFIAAEQIASTCIVPPGLQSNSEEQTHPLQLSCCKPHSFLQAPTLLKLFCLIILNTGKMTPISCLVTRGVTPAVVSA